MGIILHGQHIGLSSRVKYSKRAINFVRKCNLNYKLDRYRNDDGLHIHKMGILRTRRQRIVFIRGIRQETIRQRCEYLLNFANRKEGLDKMVQENQNLGLYD